MQTIVDLFIFVGMNYHRGLMENKLIP